MHISCLNINERWTKEYFDTDQLGEISDSDTESISEAESEERSDLESETKPPNKKKV